MHLFHRYLLLALSVTFLTGPLAAPAPTQAQRRSSRDDDASPEYRETIEEALSEIADERWAEARVLFERAHAIDPNARTLRGIGICAYEVADYVTAIVSFEGSLASERRPLDVRLRGQVEQLLARARQYVGSIALTVTPSPANVTIDGLPAIERDGKLLVNAGEHELRAEADGYLIEVRRVRVEAGTVVPIAMALATVHEPVAITMGAPVGATAAVPPSNPPPAEAPLARRHPVTVAAAISYGAAGAGLALFASFGIRALVLGGDHADGCLELGTCSQSSLDAQDRSAHIADAGLAIAAVGTTAGLLFQFLHHKPDAERAPVVSAFATPRSAGLSLRGRF